MEENGVTLPERGGDRPPAADRTGGTRPSGAPAAPPDGAQPPA
jgi:hypothetical protein